MVDVPALLARLGGVARRNELVERGASRSVLEAAENDGRILRVRRGWYALPTLPDSVIRAVRVGGALTCLSAARERGLWIPPGHPELHVAVPATAARLRRPDDPARRLRHGHPGLVLHRVTPASRTVEPLAEAIARAVRCCGERTGFVLLESALHRGLLTVGDRAILNTRAPARFRRLSSHASRLSESGTESLLKLRLLNLGVPFRQQVEIAGVGRVDFLLGDRLVVEVDSRAHHSEPSRDRRADALLSARGLRVLRFMYGQVVYERDQFTAAILGAVIRGDLAG